jgi:hypothetical protein
MMGGLWTEEALQRRQILTDEERQTLLGIPQDADSLARLFTLSRSDQHLVALRLGDASRLGFAVQLALLRHPGIVLANLEQPPEPLVIWLATQLGIPPAAFAAYAHRPQTVTDHARRLARVLGLRPPVAADLGPMIEAAAQAAWATDRGHTSPFTWERIGFSGDFLWDQAAAATAGRRRQLNVRRPKAAA